MIDHTVRLQDLNSVYPSSNCSKQLQQKNQKKKHSDLSIQNTNNSSIASKHSVERLYLSQIRKNQGIVEEQNQEYFKFFVKKSLRRSPCINRGYWLRLEAITSRLKSIIDSTINKILIINLGCGFDPLAFQLLDKKNSQHSIYRERLSFIDIDYLNLIKKKIEIIRNTPELINIIGDIKNQGDGIFCTPNYIFASCNLNEANAFDELIHKLVIDNKSTVKIFIAEVSLAYMKAEMADRIIKLCSKVPNSHFIMLEQLLPVGMGEPFSRQMLKHFEKNNSPLNSVISYHTVQSQIERFRNLGFPIVNAGDMYQLWDLVDEKIKKSIDSIESFDELEEFFLFCHHYIICHASNNISFKFTSKYKFKDIILDNSDKQCNLKIELADLPCELFQRKFGASTILPNDDIIFFSGAFNNRLKTTIFMTFDKSTINVDISKAPCARMCHTLTTVDEKTCILIGGRTAPNKPLNDVWIMRKVNGIWKWEEGPCLKTSRFRHNACNIGNGKILIYGGITTDSTFLIYDSIMNTFEKVIYPDIISNNSSSAMTFHLETQTGAIIGGENNTEISDILILFKLSANNIIFDVNLQSSTMFRRYGAKICFTSYNRLLLIGGMSPYQLFGQYNTIITIDLQEGIFLVKIPENIWSKESPLLAGFEMQVLDDSSILLFGGGAICYGFGAVWNRTLRIYPESKSNYKKLTYQICVV